jgi:anti-sigma-K factor RskA
MNNNNVDREEMLELVAAYALGTLPASEHRRVSTFMLTDAEARAEYDALRPAADLIGMSAEEPVDAARSARMKANLMATVRAEVAARNVTPIGSARSASSSRPGILVGAGLAAAVAASIALVSTIQNFSLRSDLANANARANTLQTQIATNERVQNRDREMVADLVAPDAQHITVPEGEIVRHGQHAYLVLKTLPALPKGKVYQAWTLAKNAKAMTPSITFTPSPTGVAVVALPENANGVAAIALSVEPEGGSKAPTSKPEFVRTLS